MTRLIYSYVPAMIRYYLNEEPLLKNVPTYQLGNVEEQEYVFKNMNKMVIKKTNESGGYGMLMGLQRIRQGDHRFPEPLFSKIRGSSSRSLPSAYLLRPCYMNGKLQPRRVDLRPYALCGPNGIRIVPGGLTRVALREGSLVVNSSQEAAVKIPGYWLYSWRRGCNHNIDPMLKLCQLIIFFMLSRVADSLFWMNRYMERTDGISTNAVKPITPFHRMSFNIFPGSLC